MRTTSTQRTYRYVRISLVGVILFLGIGVAVQITAGGPLASVSAAYYSPARDVFVGALCAVSLALLALSGRSLEQVLLDLAALFAPVIALVPTPALPSDGASVLVECPTDRPCVPVALLPGIANGVLTLLAVGAAGIVTAFVLARVQGAWDRPVAWALGAATTIVAGAGVWWAVSPQTFVALAHGVAAFAFFALFATVAGLAAWRPAAAHAERQGRFRVLYAVIAAGITLALAGVTTAVISRAAGSDFVDTAPVPIVFIGEAAALAFFAAFWIVQTVELWNDPDPRLRVAP